MANAIKKSPFKEATTSLLILWCVSEEQEDNMLVVADRLKSRIHIHPHAGVLSTGYRASDVRHLSEGQWNLFYLKNC